MSIGAIFDWDGVIIDSRKQHEASWERLAKEENRVLPEGHFLEGFGMKNERIIPEILKWAEDSREVLRIAARKEEIYRQLLLEDGISPLPGVREWLEVLAKAKIPCVIGSSTERANILVALDSLGLREFFPEIICAEDVRHGKPDPEVFLKAAERLRISPQRCVVFEDAHVGIQAARAGGMKVIAVATTHPRHELGEADRIVDRLDDLEIDDLASLVEK